MPRELSFAEKALRESTRTEPPDAPMPDAADRSEASALVTRNVAQATLQLRFKDGRAAAVPYPFITWYDYDPAIGITLEAPGRNIVIEGTGLIQIFEQIAAHKRVAVDELSAPGVLLAADGKRPHVTAIHIRPRKE